jgi:hypothetical protein
MEITDVLAQMGGLDSMARELGVSESQAATAADALIPAILGGFKKQAQAQPSGLDGLGSLLGQLGGGSLLDSVLSPQPTDVGRGNDVLGQIFGSRDVSRTVAQDAAARSGIDPRSSRRCCRSWRCWSPATWRGRGAARHVSLHRPAAGSVACWVRCSAAARPVPRAKAPVRWAGSHRCSI